MNLKTAMDRTQSTRAEKELDSFLTNNPNTAVGIQPRNDSRNSKFHRQVAKTLRKGKILNSILYDQRLDQAGESYFCCKSFALFAGLR